MPTFDEAVSVSEPSVVCRNVTKEFRSFSSVRSKRREKVVAVKDVSLVASKGESVGLLGQNGSGKSTLLQLIAGIDACTSGSIYATAPPTLLGVGSALVPSISGRKNIELACTAMGMSKNEIDEIFPELIELIDIGDAIDRPLNTYSSGMSARLNFAVGTASSPEILIIDEALGTGDSAFASRAGNRMAKLLEEAGTLFYVSHAAKAVEETCERAIWMHFGEIVADGPSSEICDLYRTWVQMRSTDRDDDAEDLLATTQSAYQKPEVIFDSEVL